MDYFLVSVKPMRQKENEIPEVIENETVKKSAFDFRLQKNKMSLYTKLHCRIA